MYESFYGFQNKPFSPLPNSKFLYIGEKHRKTLSRLVSGVLNQVGITLITGEVGCGKSTLIKHLEDQLEGVVTVGVLTNTRRSFDNLMQWILQAFNVKFIGTSDVVLYQIFLEFVKQEFAKHRNVLLIVDEAQNLTAQYLEELRLLTNVCTDDHVFQVILVGQLKLRELLSQPDMGHLTQRIAVEYRLNPLSLDQTEEYIQHRVEVAGGNPELFDPQACELIYSYSKGTPRLINSMCDTALLYGYEKQKKVIDGMLMSDVISEEVAVITQGSGMLQPIALEDSTARADTKLLSYASSKRSQNGSLSVITDGVVLDNYKINGSCVTIGRGHDNDIYLPDEQVSRHHAKIVSNLDGYYLEDLTSANGTYVNAKRVIGYALQDGDIIGIGKFRLCYTNTNGHDEREEEVGSYKVTELSSLPMQRGVNHPTRGKLISAKNSFSMYPKEIYPNSSEVGNKLSQPVPELPKKKRDLDEVLETLSEWIDK